MAMLRFSIVRAVAAMAACAASALCFAEETQKNMELIPPGKTFLKALPNGLTVVVRENHTAPVVAVRVYVKNTGRICEGGFSGSGISHYIEHIVAGGTTSRRSEEQNKAMLQSIGGNSNAYTQFDHTCYFINTASEFFDGALDLLSDYVQNCVFKPEEVAREKDTITKEIRRSDDTQGRASHMLFYRTLFPEHPVSLPTIGYVECFQALTRDDLASYFKERYIPQNVVLAVAGDVQPQSVYEKALAAFGSWPRGREMPQQLPPVKEMAGPKWVEEEFAASRSCIVQIGFHSVALAHRDLYALDVLALVLSMGRSSRIHNRIVEKDRLAGQAAAYSYTPSYGCGIFGGWLSELPYKNVRPAVSALLEEMERCKTEPIGAEELERAKTQCIASYVFHRQTAEDLAEEIGGNTLGVRDPDFSEKYLEGVKKVTAVEICDVAKRYITRDRMVVAVVKPPQSGAGEKTAQDASAEATGRSALITLPNGLKVVFRRSTVSPVVCLQAFCAAGLASEPEGMNGINNLTAKLLAQGTDSRTQEQIHRQLEAAGATIETMGGNNTMGVKIQTVKDGLEPAFEVFADVLLHPAFPAQEVEKLKTMAVWQIQRNKADAEEELVRLYRGRYWKTHPYRRTAEGTPEDLARITRDDASAHWARWFVPSNTVIAVFGDLTMERAKALVEKHFSGLKRVEGHSAPSLKPEPPRDRPESIDLESEFGNVNLAVGYPAPAMSDEDRFAFSILNFVVAGGSANWIHEALRGKEEGLVYTVYGSHFPGLNTGTFYVATQTTAEKADRVLQLILEQIARAVESGISAQELDLAKRAFTVGEALGSQTLAGQAQWAVLSEMFGEGYDFPEKYLERVKAITLGDVNAAAKKYFKNPLVFRMMPRGKAAGAGGK